MGLMETVYSYIKDRQPGPSGRQFSAALLTASRGPYNCTMQVPSQYHYFCEPKESECTAELAFTRIRDYYVLVGVLEHMDLTLQALAKLVPWVFAGLEKVAHAASHRSTSLFNPITKTTLNGALSTRSRKQIAERASNYEEEYRFYKQVRQLFYRRLCEINLLRRR